MNSVAVSSITAPWADDAKVLADVSLVAQQQLAPAAKRIDEGTTRSISWQASVRQALMLGI